MRVLSLGSVYPPQLMGGYEVIWQGVSRALVAAGHQSRVLVTDYRNPDVDPAAEDDADVHRELGWYWHDHTWPRFTLADRVALERSNAATFDRHLQEFQPDVIAWWAVGGMSLSLIERARRAGIPAVFFVLDYWPDYGLQHDQWLRLWRSRPRFGAVAERLSGVPTRLDLAHGRWLFCSEAMRAGVLNTGLVLSADQQAILAPGIEDWLAELPPEPAAPDWDWRLLYLGRVVEQKGVITAVDALAELPASATLTVIGSGDEDYRATLIRRAEELGVAERVIIGAPVPRERLIEAYRSADVVLHPVQWAEPWGLVPLEAMAAGRPVIATGQGGSADFLSDDVNALLHKPGDAGGLARQVRRLAGEPALRARLVATGLNTARAHTEAAFNAASLDELAHAATRR